MGLREIERLADRIDDLPDEIRTKAHGEAVGGLEQVANGARKSLARNDTNASHGLSESIDVDSETVTLTVDAPHGPYVEYGTGSHFGDSGFDIPDGVGRYPSPSAVSAEMVDALDNWIAVKGITPRKVSRDELPWVIADSIVEEGTPAQPFIRPNWYQNRNRILHDIERAVARAVRRV